MKDIEVVDDGTGSSFLVYHASGGTRRPPYAVSLSHTTHAAVAVVVRIEALTVVPPARALPPIPALPFFVPSRHRGSLVPTLLGLVALGVAIGALMRTFWIAR
jgi:hypothetical protein